MCDRLTFTATGTYDREIPVDLIHALLAEIESHMKAYGFKEIQVETFEDPKCAAATDLYDALEAIMDGFREARSANPEAWAEFVNEVCEPHTFNANWNTARAALLKVNPAREDKTDAR